MGELKSSGDITNSLLKALNAENGLDLKALTARLSSSEQEALETNLIRGVIEKITKDGITDFSKVSDTLKNAPFESKRVVEIMGELNKKAPILNNTSSLLEKLTAINPKAKELQQGIGHSVTGALMTMKRNLAIERLKSLLPVLGNDASLKNHIRSAINNAGDLKSVINNLEKIEIKDAPENSTKLLEAFKNEVKALREEAQNAEIKGDNFITKQSPAPKSDLSVRINNGAYRQHSMIRPNDDMVEQKALKDTKVNNAIKELKKVDISTLNSEQKNIYDVFVGKKDKIVLQGHDLNDLYSFEYGSRNAGAKKIMIKHAGVEKTGGLNNNELLNIMDVIRSGDINSESFEKLPDKIRYAYTLEKNDVKLKVVVDEYNDGKKIFDYYSNRNFIDYSNKIRADTDNSKTSVEKLLDAIDTSSDKVGLVKKVLLNKDISDGVKAKAVNRLTKNKISQGVKTSYISTKNSNNN